MKKYLFLLLPLFLYLLGVWDLDGLRQGTETFYLKVAREMADTFSIMTPLHRGEPHWSKPPFVFWISFPFYWMLPIAHHTAARLSIILLTFLCTFLFAKEVSRNNSFDVKALFVVLISSFGFFRYGKIYMMDIPLALLSSLSILYFYNSQIHKNSRLLIWAILTLASSILVKGPISLVMIGLALVAFGLLNKENRQLSLLKNGMLYLTAGSALASIWFIICYFNHGQEFIDYFFLRENLGKFESKAYPIRKLFQGLLLYGLPWTFVTLLVPKELKQFDWHNLVKNRFNSFCLVTFLSFFFIWFIPTQRSHHYAIPALPFFLVLIFPLIHKFQEIFQRKLSVLIFAIFGIIGLAIGINFIQSFSWQPIVVSLALLALIPLAFKVKNDTYAQGLIFLCGLSIIWSLLIPLFSLSKLPHRSAAQIKQGKVYSVFKKNYYFEQVLDQSILGLRENEVASHSKSQAGYYILTESFYNRIKGQSNLQILSKWPVWKRRVRWPAIKQALKSKDITTLQENYLLLQSTQMD